MGEKNKDLTTNVSSGFNILAQNLKQRKKQNTRSYRLLLASLPTSVIGYQALAYLIKQGYFPTLILTHTHPHLQQALQQFHVQYEYLVAGQDGDELIASALDGQVQSKCIIQLGGSSHDRAPSHLSAAIQRSLKDYLSQDIIIIGSLESGLALSHLFAGRDGSLYYVHPQPGNSDGLLERMQIELFEASVITEHYGEFENFFVGLLEKLEGSASRTIPWMLPASQEPATRAPRPDAAAPASAKPLPKTQKSSSKKVSADVLLVTITLVETGAVLKQCPGWKSQVINNRTYYRFGMINGSQVFLIEALDMGPRGASSTIEEGIQTLSPGAVIMVGIAFGFPEKVHQIGDILVSRSIRDYDAQRVGSGPELEPVIGLRGHLVEASERLRDRFNAAYHSWQKPPDIHFGLILSGRKLVDNKAFRDQLHRVAPDALGGEMEGIGLYEAASRFGVEWILVKAVCDWADGQKHSNENENQALAAENAARFTFHVLGQGEFIKSPRKVLRRKKT